MRHAMLYRNLHTHAGTTEQHSLEPAWILPLTGASSATGCRAGDVPAAAEVVFA